MDTQNIKMKYAWLPRKVRTWRRNSSWAMIWLQEYYVDGNKEYCLRLGKLAYEY